MTELNPDPEYWTPPMLAQAILGIWFAAAHQPWMNLDFIMLQLCSRPDYVEELRSEIDDMKPSCYDDIVKLPLLDSFVKEVVRTTPLDSRKSIFIILFLDIWKRNCTKQFLYVIVAIRRKAMAPFRFSGGGPYIKEGELVCVSLDDAMHDENTYPSADHFDGRRFMKTTAKFTDISEKYPVWGFGSLAW